MMGEKGERTAAVVLAAGQRMQSGVAKQYLLLKERPVIWYSLEAFEKSPVDEVILVTGKEETDWVREHIVDRYGFKKVRAVVAGGAERYHSVCRGLSALDGQDQRPDLVLIHDGARPLISEEVIRRTIEAAREDGACVAAVPVKDTVKVADGDQFAETTLDRSLLWQIQTPQAFRYGLVKGAYDSLMADPALQKGITDDAMVVERMTNEKVKLVMGDYRNIKVTTPEDMTVAAAFLDDLKETGYGKVCVFAHGGTIRAALIYAGKYNFNQAFTDDVNYGAQVKMTI